jgi:phosphoglycerol transferase MdoB-like AlkP superfamily enzyme
MDASQPLDHGFINSQPSVAEQQQIRELKKEFFSNLQPINRGRITLALLILVELIGFLLSLNTTTGVEVAVIPMIILPFFVLLILSGKYPRQALIGSFGFYLFLSAVLIFVDPLNLIRGILIRSLICYFLFQGMHFAKRNEEITNTLEQFGEVPFKQYWRK